MDTDTLANVWVGAALPLVIAVINQRRWPSPVKGLVALVCCAVAALATVWLRGPVDWSDWRSTATWITGAAFISYHTLWKPSTIAPKIEAATSTGGPPPPAA